MKKYFPLCLALALAWSSPVVRGDDIAGPSPSPGTGELAPVAADWSMKPSCEAHTLRPFCNAFLLRLLASKSRAPPIRFRRLTWNRNSFHHPIMGRENPVVTMTALHTRWKSLLLRWTRPQTQISGNLPQWSLWKRSGRRAFQRMSRLRSLLRRPLCATSSRRQVSPAWNRRSTHAHHRSGCGRGKVRCGAAPDCGYVGD